MTAARRLAAGRGGLFHDMLISGAEWGGSLLIRQGRTLCR